MESSQSKQSLFTVWRIRRGLDRRFRAGHPWVYSNELMESPKGVEPGSAVQLQDASGKFLAWGYGNPQSLIAFRSMSRIPNDSDGTGNASIVGLLQRSRRIRRQLGFGDVSHRLCFGEADGIPGLVIDAYRTRNGFQVFSVQAHTAGADRISSRILEILKELVESDSSLLGWEKTSVVLRNDLGVRKLEGLTEDAPRVLKEISGLDLTKIDLSIASITQRKPLQLKADLLLGQKTGFFLDQFSNIQLAYQRFLNLNLLLPKKKLRILDLCCYVGQWGAQLANAFRESGVEVEVVAVDASKKALEFARLNIEAQGASCSLVQADVLRDLAAMESESFDLVICDPPALIKTRKDIPTGRHAYLQLNTQAMRLTKKGGGIVCCSCSALLEEEVFCEVLAKASQRNQATIQWVGRGSQSPDHPMLAEFPEGRYLKSWMGVRLE
jgi:23S rRNA (cytosine1962-C5)-methyltransferase